MRLAPLTRRLGAAVLALSIGAGASACASGARTDGSPDETPAAPSDTPSRTSAADPAAPAEQASFAELSADDFASSVLTALQDAGSFRFTTTSDAAGQALDVTGQARFGDDGIEMKASGTGAQAMDLIVVDGAMYVRSEALGTGRRWFEVDLSDPSSFYGAIGKAADPAVMLEAMRSPEELELVGSERVDGVETNRYRITMDPAAYLEAMGLPAAMSGMLPEQVSIDMWVDADNLPRRFALDLQPGASGTGTASTASVEGTYSDFGADVDIEAPPADQVTEKPGA